MGKSLLARLFGGGSPSDRDEETVAAADGEDADAEDPDAEASGDGAPDAGSADDEASAADAADDATADDPADEEGSGSVWDLIPSWEYDGKYVQSGGHSRGEQERALQDIQRQAEEIERSEKESEPRPDR